MCKRAEKNIIFLNYLLIFYLYFFNTCIKRLLYTYIKRRSRFILDYIKKFLWIENKRYSTVGPAFYAWQQETLTLWSARCLQSFIFFLFLICLVVLFDSLPYSLTINNCNVFNFIVLMHTVEDDCLHCFSDIRLKRHVRINYRGPAADMLIYLEYTHTHTIHAYLYSDIKFTYVLWINTHTFFTFLQRFNHPNSSIKTNLFRSILLVW